MASENGGELTLCLSADEKRAKSYLHTLWPYAARHDLSVQAASELGLTKKHMTMIAWARMYCSGDEETRALAICSIEQFEKLPSSDEENDDEVEALSAAVWVGYDALVPLGARSPKRYMEEQQAPSWAIAKMQRLEEELGEKNRQIAAMGRSQSAALATVTSLEADNRVLERHNSELSMGHSPSPHNDKFTARFGVEIDPTTGTEKEMMVRDDANRLRDAMVEKSKVSKSCRKLMAKYLRLHNTGNPALKDKRQQRSPLEAFLRNEYDIDMHAVRRDTDMAKNLWALCLYPGHCDVAGAGTSYDPLGTSCKLTDVQRKCGAEMPFHWSDDDARTDALAGNNRTGITPTDRDNWLMPPPVAPVSEMPTETIADRLSPNLTRAPGPVALAGVAPRDLSPPIITSKRTASFPQISRVAGITPC